MLTLLPQQPSDVRSKLAVMNAAQDLLDALEKALPLLKKDVQARIELLYTSPNLEPGERVLNAAFLRQAGTYQRAVDAAESAIAKARGAQ